jgi:hypothetical protein
MRKIDAVPRPVFAALLVATTLSAAAERANLSGQVTDNKGKPLENATVMIFHAGVKKGYSTFCPSCYVDCGKRAVTDRSGTFRFQNLDPDLWFELLVIHDGYTATFVKRVDPAQGPAPDAKLAPRPPVTDLSRVVRGRVVDSHGQAMRAAVITPQGVSTESTDHRSSYGEITGLEPIAVTNSRGDFELAYNRKADGMVILVEARGMASRVLALPTGARTTTITVSDGAVVRGRLMNHGKPVGGAQLGLFPQQRGGYGANLKIAKRLFSMARWRPLRRDSDWHAARRNLRHYECPRTGGLVHLCQDGLHRGSGRDRAGKAVHQARQRRGERWRHRNSTRLPALWEGNLERRRSHLERHADDPWLQGWL